LKTNLDAEKRNCETLKQNVALKNIKIDELIWQNESKIHGLTLEF